MSATPLPSRLEQLLTWCAEYAVKTPRQDIRLDTMPDAALSLIGQEGGYGGPPNHATTQAAILLWTLSDPAAQATGGGEVVADIDTLVTASRQVLAAATFEIAKRRGWIEEACGPVSSIFDPDASWRIRMTPEGRAAAAAIVEAGWP